MSWFRAKPTEAKLRDALCALPDPLTGADLVTAGRVEAASVSGGTATVTLAIDPAAAAAYEPIRASAERLLRDIPGVETAAVILTAHSAGGPSAATPATNAPKGPPPQLGPKSAPKPPEPIEIEGVRHVIAIGSGKGGVGKSTVSANLAIALTQGGWRVGLLDADIYGPSQPRMMGLENAPPPTSLPIPPAEAFGVKVMSIGLIVPADEAVVWRGPMLMKAITQLTHQVAWAPLDALLVDLPPGTGDVQLSLSQRATLAGAIVVSTPQDVALLDARKALNMFDKLQIPVLGLIENMSHYVCPKCGHEAHVFGDGGVAREAEAIGAPLLGRLPLDLETRQAGDAGAPVAADASTPQAAAYQAVAAQVMARLG